MRFLSLGIVLLITLAMSTASQAGNFPLKDGDSWVMAGDSITAQHLHSNYFEAFCYARYPKLKFSFRNSGVGGHTIPSTLARFDYDVMGWKPTVVSVELGMNDAGRTPTDQFIKNMEKMVERIRTANARPIIFSASPVNDGSTMAKLARHNVRLNEYAIALKKYCETEKLLYADQFHALVDIWGKTMHSEKPISMHGDAVHPGPNGQLMMAAALLKALGAEPFVSSVTVDFAAASGDPKKAAAAKGCSVTNLAASAMGNLEFDRLDECLPFPIPDNARTVLPLAPDVLELSQYLLTVNNLPAGDYVLMINSVPSAVLTAKQLAAGVNLTDLPANPAVKSANAITAQSQSLLKAVEAKEALVSKWRALSKKALAVGAETEILEKLMAMSEQIEQADVKIREAAKPQKLHFEIVPKK